MTATDFQRLAGLFPNEVVTHSYVSDVELPGVPARLHSSPWTTT